MTANFDHLPGGDLIEEGLIDLAAGIESQASLLVEIAHPRLRSLGISIPDASFQKEAELRLYRLLRAEYPTDAYSQYNSLIRRLVSFEQALESRVWRRRRRGVTELAES